MPTCLELFVGAYRDAMETLSETEPEYSFLKDFPGGCCSLSVEMMCSHLKELGYTSAEYTGNGWSQIYDRSHTWLKWGDGTVIDITLDQVDPELPRIYIGDKLPIHEDIKDEKQNVHMEFYDLAMIQRVRAAVQEKLDSTSFAENYRMEWEIHS